MSAGAAGHDGFWLLGAGLLAAMAIRSQRTSRLRLLEWRRERRIREELEAYARLEVSQAAQTYAGKSAVEASRSLGRRICRAVSQRSIFTRVAMLLRDADGRFVCVGRAGIDDLTLTALHAWGQGQTEGERGGAAGKSGRMAGEAGVGEPTHRDGAAMNGAHKVDGAHPLRKDARSFSISLGDWQGFDAEVGSWALSGRRERRKARWAMAVPFRNSAGRMLGAIVVCSDGAGYDESVQAEGLARGLGAIEALAGRIAATLENEAMAERLLRAEKLAGLGQLAGGVAHALNNPLTAVLGFAELIAESTGDARVREDARTILAEAVRMKQTVGRLIEFWRPSTMANEAVDVIAMLQELERTCAGRLRELGLRLELILPEHVPTLRGSRDRLRQVMEHLLNNAAQAIGEFRPLEADEAEHAIRVTVSFDERALQLIVSDTGPGFTAPGRVFDPFYTTNETAAGAGVGLSICYSTVREHGGAISAFNLHPHGAAVVMELPLGLTVEDSGQMDAALEGVSGGLAGLDKGENAPWLVRLAS